MAAAFTRLAFLAGVDEDYPFIAALRMSPVFHSAMSPL